MTVPGMNVLGAALSVLGRQTVDYYRDIGRVTLPSGRDDTQFAEPVPVAGSFQPLNMATVQMLGLDMAKTWATFHAPVSTIDPSRGHSGDELEYFGQRYHAESVVDWKAQDGWTWSLWVAIGPTTDDLILIEGGFLLFCGEGGHLELIGG